MTRSDEEKTLLTVTLTNKQVLLTRELTTNYEYQYNDTENGLF